MAADSKKLKYTRDEIDKLLDQVQTNHTDIVNNRTAAETAEADSILRDETLQSNICAEQERAEGRENAIEDKFDKAIEEIDARSDVVAVVGTVTGAKNSLESWKNDKGVALGKITKNDVVKVLKDETDGHKDLTSYYRYNGAAKTDSPVWPDNWEWVGSSDQYVVAGHFNLENGSGSGSAQMKQDGTSGTFSFTGKNANAAALDDTLTGDIPFGATGAYASSFGGESQASGKRSFACGTTTIAKGAYSFASGDNSVALGNDSFVCNYATTAQGMASFAQGVETQVKTTLYAKPSGSSSAGGTGGDAPSVPTTDVNGQGAAAMGVKTQSNGYGSLATGISTISNNTGTFTSGVNTFANGFGAVAVGTSSEADGTDSFAGGTSSWAKKDNSFAFGNGVQTLNEDETVVGRYNATSGKLGGDLFVVGKGESDSNRSDAFRVTRSGQAYLAASGTDNEHVARMADVYAVQTWADNRYLDKRSNAGEQYVYSTVKFFNNKATFYKGITVETAPTESNDVVRKNELDAEASRATAAESSIESGYMKKDREEDITGKKTFEGRIEVAAHSDGKGDEFLFSGIKAASANADRPVWFAFSDGSSVVNGTPTYDTDFEYNPSTNKLSIGSVTLAGADSKITAKDVFLSGTASAKDLTVSGSATVSGAAKVDGLSTLRRIQINPESDETRWYASGGAYGIDLWNSDLIRVNSIYTCDPADNTAEGIRFYRDGTSWDTLTSAGGVLYYMPNDPLAGSQLSSANQVLHSGNYSAQIKKVALSEASTASYAIDSSSDSATIATKGYAEDYADGLMSALNIESGTAAGSLQTKSGSNSATGANSFAGGKSATASHAGAFAWGEGVKTGRDNQIALGKYNTGSSTNVFEVGIGASASDSGRKNAFWVTSGGVVYAQGASEKAEHSLVRLDVMNGAIEDLALKDASKKGVVDSSDSLASSEDLPTGKAVADYIANQIAGKTSIAYVIDSSSSSGANAEFNEATSSSIDYFDIDSYSSKSLSTVGGETVSCSDLKVGDIVYTKDADVKDWFLGAKTDSKLTFYQISADTATLSGYVQKSGSEMTGTLKLKNSDSALYVSGPADFSSGVTISGKNFNYSGIETTTTDSARAIWFSDSTVKGKPVYDAEFTYNPKSDELSVGSVVEGGTSLSDKYEAKGHTHSASLKDSAGNDVSSLSANTEYKLTAGGASVTFTTPKDSDTHYTNSLAVEVGGVQAVKFSQDADKTLKLTAGDNVELSATAGGGEIKISSSYVDTDTTYDFEGGTDGGTFKVTPSGGKAQTVQTKAWDASIGEADASDAVDQDLKLGTSYKITAGGDSITFKMPDNTEAAASNITFDKDETAGYTIGGLKEGVKLQNMSIEEIIYKIFHKFNSPSGLTMTLLKSDGSEVQTSCTYTYPNASPTVTVASIKWSVTRGAEESGTLTLSGAASATSDVTGDTASGTITLSSPVEISAGSSSKSFALKYAYEDDAGNQQSINASGKSISFTQNYKRYYGTASTNAPTATEVAEMSSSTMTSKNFTNTYTLSNSMAVYAYPKVLKELSSIKDANNFELLSGFNQTTQTIDGAEYYVYALRTANTSTPTYTFK